MGYSGAGAVCQGAFTLAPVLVLVLVEALAFRSRATGGPLAGLHLFETHFTDALLRCRCGFRVTGAAVRELELGPGASTPKSGVGPPFCQLGWFTIIVSKRDPHKPSGGPPHAGRCILLRSQDSPGNRPGMGDSDPEFDVLAVEVDEQRARRPRGTGGGPQQASQSGHSASLNGEESDDDGKK